MPVFENVVRIIDIVVLDDCKTHSASVTHLEWCDIPRHIEAGLICHGRDRRHWCTERSRVTVRIGWEVH
jgi:hypothetical protein